MMDLWLSDGWTATCCGTLWGKDEGEGRANSFVLLVRVERAAVDKGVAWKEEFGLSHVSFQAMMDHPSQRRAPRVFECWYGKVLNIAAWAA